MKQAQPDLAALLDVERELSAPTTLDRARNRRALARNLGLAGALSAATAKGSLTAWLAGHAGVKLAATIALVAAGTGSVAWLATSQRAPNEPASATSQPPVPPATTLATPIGTTSLGESAVPSAAPTAPVIRSDRAPVDAKALVAAPAPAPAAAAAPSVRAFPDDSDDQLAAETKLVTSAQAALHAGAPARSLALLERAKREFPSGALREEASATRVFALCKLGRRAEAHTAASSFLQTFPRSLLTGRVGASCRD